MLGENAISAIRYVADRNDEVAVAWKDLRTSSQDISRSNLEYVANAEDVTGSRIHSTDDSSRHTLDTITVAPSTNLMTGVPHQHSSLRLL